MKPELLCPAGALANLKAAVVSGADAVYLGLTNFSARAYAKNFNKDYLKEAVKISKSNNVRLFLTMNTLIKNNEIKEFFSELDNAYLSGIDAVIIQDPSFIEIIRSSFPELKIHISTQAGVMNSMHASILNSVDRINLARELSKENISSIRKNFKKEIEMFVHGALCVCVSGSCLFSSFIGKRSANRGKCAQPCRAIYDKGYYLSTKELCLIEKINELKKLGIDSLKIEGRLRTPYYVATTASIYRQAIDNDNFILTKEIKDKLSSAYSREFTKGPYSHEDVFNRKQGYGISKVIENTYEPKTTPISINRKSNLVLPKIENKKAEKKQLLVRVYTKEDAIAVDKAGADIIYLDMFDKNFIETKNSLKKPLYAYTPRIMFDSDKDAIINRIKEINPAGLFIGNLGMLKLARDLKLNIPMHLDYNCNCFNDLSLAYYESLGLFPIISPELSIKEQSEFKNKNFASLVHGKIRLMTLAHKLEKNSITDKKNFKFKINPIRNGSEILNEKEIGLFNKAKNLLSCQVTSFFIDTDEDVSNIVNIYRQILDGKTQDVSKIKNKYVLGWSQEGVL
ncbi:MAG: U32 family peptidase [Candidatus Nanoarchaeia archaeon]